VIIYGKVTGNIMASERCELKANGHLYGDLRTARLIIEEGATFVGKSEVAPEGKLKNLQSERAEAAPAQAKSS
jgi:cytoskeletal protein CcmA (bactofilin family)